MSALATWREQAEVALVTEAWGDEIHAGLRALAVEAEALWPSLDTPGRHAVLQSLRAIGARIEADMHHIEGELAQSARRRAGVRGYGQLQSCHRGQRLRRRV